MRYGFHFFNNAPIERAQFEMLYRRAEEWRRQDEAAAEAPRNPHEAEPDTSAHAQTDSLESNHHVAPITEMASDSVGNTNAEVCLDA